MRIHRNMRLGELYESDYNGCFPITSRQEDITELVIRRPRKEYYNTWIYIVQKKLADSPASAIFTSAACEPIDKDMPYIPSNSNGQPIVEILPSAEDKVLPNRVTTYRNVPELATTANKFPELQIEGGFAEVPQNEQIRIPLRSDQEDKALKIVRVYPLSNKAKEIINKIFDKLYNQGRIDQTNKAIPFSYPIFVVWTTKANSTRKGRVVIDIRGLNAIS